MRFRLRTLLVVVTALGCCLSFVVWWTLPYIERNEPFHGDGEIEQYWYRRTLLGDKVHVATIRHHPNGKKAYEWRTSQHDPRVGKARWWLEDGREVSEEVFFREAN